MKNVKLGDLTSIQTGKIDVNKAVAGGKYPFFTCSRDVYEINDAPFQGKAVLVAGNGDLNVKYYEGKFNAYQRTYFLFVNDENELIPRYLYWFLESYVGQLRTQAIGSTIKYIKMGNLTEAEIPLPPLEKQREIVERLDATFAEIDILEENLGLSDEKADQLLQSFLSSAFSSTAEENDLSNDPGDKTIATKLVPLGDVCTVINGGTPDTKNSRFWDGKHAWITPAEMGDLKSPYLVSSKRTLTDEGLSNSSAQLVPKHSVIMSSRAPIGHLVINKIPMASNQGCKGMIPNENLNYKYLYYFLYANKQYLNKLGSGTTFAEISGSKLKTVLIPLFSLAKQSEVVEKLDSVFTSIELLKAQIKIEKNYAQALRQSLLSSAFSQKEVVA
jgi:restriction endonuclease S subunit